MMLVKILEFGSNWWARFGRDPHDRYRYTKHAAYFNSTGVRCGSKMRRYWVVPGLIRFNGVGDFNPQFPEPRCRGDLRMHRSCLCARRQSSAVSTESRTIVSAGLLPLGRIERQVRRG